MPPTISTSSKTKTIKRDIVPSQKSTHSLLPRAGVLCIAPRTMNAHARQADICITRPIVLVGLMGVGKSTVGRRLAQRLHVSFVDADHEIEQAAGITISEIFARYGEATFRDGERRVIARLIRGAPKVIATGGGAFMNEVTRALVLEKCTAVWIDADINVLAERVGRRDNRPLLKGRDAAAVLTELAAVRNPVYALAPIHVRSLQGPHDAMVNAILEQLA